MLLCCLKYVLYIKNGIEFNFVWNKLLIFYKVFMKKEMIIGMVIVLMRSWR